MNRKPGDCVATHLGLQGFAVVAVELVRHPQPRVGTFSLTQHPQRWCR